MRWIKFPSGARYTLAVDIQKTAEQHGYTVPCEADGTRHPGTDCNAKMRSIMKDAGLRRSFGITEYSVVDVRAEDSFTNEAFLRWLVDAGITTSYYLKLGVVQLYTENAVNALLSVMLKTEVSYTPDDDDEIIECGALLTKKVHNFEKKKNRPKVSLFSEYNKYGRS